MPGKTVVDVEVRWARNGVSPEPALTNALRDLDPAMRCDAFAVVDDGKVVRRSYRFRVRPEVALADLAARLEADSAVLGFKIDPRDD
jgi:putative Mg2+ transporter-C (MgtC) family protein